MSDLVTRLRDLKERFIMQGGSEFAVSIADRIEALEAENAALREDAERYRWLKGKARMEYADTTCEFDARMFWRIPSLIGLTCINTEVSFDEAIDLARKAK